VADPAEERLLQPFVKLRKPELQRLVAFFERDDLVVKGTDRSPGPGYRGGCMPFVLASLALFLGWRGEDWGLTRPVSLGVAMAMAVIASNQLIRTVVAARRSKRLLAADGGWHGLAWTAGEVCFRSLQTCCVIPWGDVDEVVLMEGEEASPLLRGTLWLHLADKEKVLIEPRAEGGVFAGRPMEDWKADLDAALAESRA